MPPLDGGEFASNWGDFLRNVKIGGEKWKEMSNGLYVCPVKGGDPSKTRNDYMWGNPANKDCFPYGTLSDALAPSTPIAGDTVIGNSSYHGNLPTKVNILLFGGSVQTVKPDSDYFKKAYDQNCLRRPETFTPGKYGSLEATPDQARLLTISSSGTASLLDGENLKKQSIPAFEDRNIQAISVSHKGNLLAVADDQNNVLVYSWKSSEVTHKWTPESVNAIQDLAFAPNGKRLVVSSGTTDSLPVYSLTEEQSVKPLKRPESTGNPTTVRSIPDQNWIVGGTKDGSVLVWSLEDDAHEKTIGVTDSEITTLQYGSSPNHLFAGTENSIYRIHVKKKEITRFQDKPGSGFAVDGSNNQLYTAHEKKEHITILSSKTGEIKEILKVDHELKQSEKQNLKKLIEQLGSRRIEKRKQAERKLLRRAKTLDPAGMVPFIEQRITQENNPEITSRLKNIRKEAREQFHTDSGTLPIRDILTTSEGEQLWYLSRTGFLKYISTDDGKTLKKQNVR